MNFVEKAWKTLDIESAWIFFCNIPKFIFQKFICKTILIIRRFYVQTFFLIFNLFVSFNKNPMENTAGYFVNMRILFHFAPTRAPQKSKVANFCVKWIYGDLLFREMRQWCHKLMFQLKTEFDFYHQHLQRSFLKPSIKSFPQGYTTYNDQNNQSNVINDHLIFHELLLTYT